MVQFLKVAGVTAAAIAAITAVLGTAFYKLVERETRSTIKPSHNRRREDHESGQAKEPELPARV